MKVWDWLEYFFSLIVTHLSLSGVMSLFHSLQSGRSWMKLGMEKVISQLAGRPAKLDEDTRCNSMNSTNSSSWEATLLFTVQSTSKLITSS